MNKFKKMSVMENSLETTTLDETFGKKLNKSRKTRQEQKILIYFFDVMFELYCQDVFSGQEEWTLDCLAIHFEIFSTISRFTKTLNLSRLETREATCRQVK